MPRVVHIAIKVSDLDAAAEFYEKVLGFTPVGRSRSPDRSRAALTDGEMNVTFLRYDDEDSWMAKAGGEGPSIHHIGIEVEDMAAYVAALQASGAELLNGPDEVPVKFRMPGGPLAEIVPPGRYPRGGSTANER
jgi:lactoylglutathione lyase